MRLGIFTGLFMLAEKQFEETLDFLSELGLQSVELCPRSGSAFLDLDELLRDAAALRKVRDGLTRHGLEVSALACHGNPVHPKKEAAEESHQLFVQMVHLAERMGVNSVVTFSGCPGDFPGAIHPNWVSCPWPDEYLEILKYQWDDVLIPYWVRAAEFARSHGVSRICIEPHPGFNVYNPETLLRLRAAVGDTIGANFDPSHFFWQGIDPSAAIRELGPAIYHCHIKDTRLDGMNVAKNGVIDTKHYGDVKNRAWLFRTVGYGHDLAVWKEIVMSLKIVGYGGALSIEHEDGFMSIREGVSKAVGFMKQVFIFEEPDGVSERIYPPGE